MANGTADSRFVGLDVHADTISIAVADCDGDVRRYGKIPTALDAIRRAMKKLGAMNLADVKPNRLAEIFLFSHPPISKRIQFARDFKMSAT